MKRFTTVDAYIDHHVKFKPVLQKLRNLISTTELEETVKWGMPTYTIKGKNVVGISAFKNHAGIWFFQGALLADKDKILKNAQEGKTKAMRQMRFTDPGQVDDEIVLTYLAEAIQNEKAGKRIAISRNKTLILPSALKEALSKDKTLHSAFNGFTLGRQREFAEYIDSAKREATVLNRLEKIIPMIKSGVGLNDKYR